MITQNGCSAPKRRLLLLNALTDEVIRLTKHLMVRIVHTVGRSEYFEWRRESVPIASFRSVYLSVVAPSEH